MPGLPPDDDGYEYSDEDAPDAPPRNRKVSATLPERRSKKGSPVTPLGTWQENVSRTKEGEIKGTPGNLALYLQNDPEWSGCLGYNNFREAEVWLRDPPGSPGHSAPKTGQELADEHDVYIHHWFDRNRQFSCTNTTLGVMAAARGNTFDPLQQYLEGLKWDKVSRVSRWLPVYFGAKDTPYSRAVGSMWLISAIVRAMNPGGKVDTMVILEGEQGSGKSSGLAAMCPKEEWFSDTPIDFKRIVDAYQSLKGKWLYEVGELDSFKGAEVTRIKNFLSSRADNYRASYGKRPRDVPRHCVFAGTTNEDQYLTDRSGNRRFWPVSCGQVQVRALGEDRDQIWAEAMELWRQGEKWFASDDERMQELIKRQQSSRLVPDDPWKILVERWLKQPTVPTEGGLHGERSLVRLEDGFCAEDALMGAVGIRKDSMTLSMPSRMGHVLKSLDYYPRQVRQADGSRPRLYFYGKQEEE